MLCCWLQQLQEFGGPEVDKPDLLKGSIGSLKNQGLATTTAKTNSGSGSLAKHNTLLDMRARYNVSFHSFFVFFIITSFCLLFDVHKKAIMKFIMLDKDEFI